MKFAGKALYSNYIEYIKADLARRDLARNDFPFFVFLMVNTFLKLAISKLKELSTGPGRNLGIKANERA